MWKAKDKKDPISVRVHISVDSMLDSSLHKFVCALAALELTEPTLELCISTEMHDDQSSQNLSVSVNGVPVTDYQAQEIVKKIQTSNSIMFYNSTEPYNSYLIRRRFSGLFGNVSTVDREKIDTIQSKFQQVIKKIAQKHQHDLEELLGRLEDKYKVSLKIPTLNTDSLPFSISLGSKGGDVALDDWGSGTRNRTLILLTLFQARKISSSASLASRITPVIVIEEPESFLHPSAQAEFGRVLQDLSEEFKVQVVATTHSPYMLSQSRPESNILLYRRTVRGQPSGTEKADTSGDKWMEPFALSLGIDNHEFDPWKHLIFNSENRILLVEGETDVKYWKLLRDEKHGSNRLQYDGEIVSYEGCGSLTNTVLLKFVQGRYRNFFVTYDLDVEDSVIKTLAALKLQKHIHYLAMGKEQAGKRDIEGLVPDHIRAKVYVEHADYVAALGGTTNERNEAKKKLKELIFTEFEKNAVPGDDYTEFYKAVKIVDLAFKR
jgi:putative ATP-dependent endonuclease of the OLD family